MIPNIVHGGDMRGLTRYLVSQSQAIADRTGNVHTNPHVVGGDPFLVAYYGTEELGTEAAKEIADYLDAARLAYGTEVRRQVGKGVDGDTGNVLAREWVDSHVFHCSLSLPVTDGQRGDEEWGTIAQKFMDKMGFTEASGKSPARWVAIHHGQSAGGNDHIHIAASRVREDGTRVALFREFRQAQTACRELERELGLQQLDSGKDAASQRGVTRADLRRVSAGRQLGIAAELEGAVRSAATASVTEDEWIRRMRKEHKLIVKPYYARGTTDVVDGYKVALPPEKCEGQWVFFSGRRLANDLSLNSLRAQWGPCTAQQSLDASAEWNAALRAQRPVIHDGRETRVLSGEASQRIAIRIADANAQLRAAATTDTATWSSVASGVAGSFASLARREPAMRGELIDMARTVGRSSYRAQQIADTPLRRRIRLAHGGAAAILIQAAQPDGRASTGALMMQVMSTVAALRDWQIARGRYAEATRLHERVIVRAQQLPELRTSPVRGQASAHAPIVGLDPTGPAAPRGISHIPNRVATDGGRDHGTSR